ncbi:helix-turn-helix domain-containing protein [Haloarcula salina]|uniref:Helix-turn-helix transcriptional regulator n=1 Tax=Haloarcula salina TaxID=1429914 RepID=A0AA41KKG4_9EURY|nr:helix-turn-helix transcriptional regulator [Haloarcula salina]MBV0901854.1 helix-turn-helix transcriptional regulator [Haloarcula salina]
MGVSEVDEIDVHDISPMAWRLLRVAAGYGQREVEVEIDDIMQAHISMLENNNRSLSQERLDVLFDLYHSELTDEQVCVLVSNF